MYTSSFCNILWTDSTTSPDCRRMWTLWLGIGTTLLPMWNCSICLLVTCLLRWNSWWNVLTHMVRRLLIWTFNVYVNNWRIFQAYTTIRKSYKRHLFWFTILYFINCSALPYLHYTQFLLCSSFKVKLKKIKFYKLFITCPTTQFKLKCVYVRSYILVSLGQTFYTSICTLIVLPLCWMSVSYCSIWFLLCMYVRIAGAEKMSIMSHGFT